VTEWAVLGSAGHVLRIYTGYSPPYVTEGLTVRPVSEVDPEKVDLYYKDWNK